MRGMEEKRRIASGGVPDYGLGAMWLAFIAVEMSRGH